MKFYFVEPTQVNAETTKLSLRFGEAATNQEILEELHASIPQITAEAGSGRTLLLNGPASLPVAVLITHAFVHMFSEIGVFDPKLKAYVIAVSHGGRNIGTLIGESGETL